MRRQQRRDHPVRRHQQRGARHGLDPPSARRGRRSATSASATDRSSARRGRRCSPTPCGPRCSTAQPTRTPTLLEGSLQQVEGFEGTLTTYLAQCSADPACAFHNDGDAEGAFDQLMLKLDAKPIPSVDGSPRRRRVAWRCRAVAEAMYSDASWPALSQALADAQQGDGAGLLALYDEYYQYNGVGLGQRARGVPDDQLHGHRRAPDGRGGRRHGAAVQRGRARGSRRARPAATSARSSRSPAIRGSTSPAPAPVRSSCAARPATRRRRCRARATWPRRSRTAASIVIEADQHTCYGATPCADDIIDDYLVDLAIPAEETDCPA